MPVFPARALLQIQTPELIENEDMNGAMAQVIPMHFSPGGMPPDFIIFIDHWELLVRGGADPLAQRWRDTIRKSDPLQQ
jgi:hypothetical protein